MQEVGKAMGREEKRPILLYMCYIEKDPNCGAKVTARNG